MTNRIKKVKSAFITSLLLCGLVNLPLFAQQGSPPYNGGQPAYATQNRAEFHQWKKDHPEAAAELKRRKKIHKAWAKQKPNTITPQQEQQREIDWQRANPAAARDLQQYEIAHPELYKYP